MAFHDVCSEPPGLTTYLFSAAHFSAKQAGDLSTLFDVGGIMGEALPHAALGSIPPFFCGGREGRDRSNVTYLGRWHQRKKGLPPSSGALRELTLVFDLPIKQWVQGGLQREKLASSGCPGPG